MNRLKSDLGLPNRMNPINVTISVNAGREFIGIIDMPQAASDTETEMVLGDGFVAQKETETHVGMLPSALQKTGIGGGTPGHTIYLSMMG
ncbi:MAG: hypothetical protein ABL974_18510 [Prosthecobacter sp.]